MFAFADTSVSIIKDSVDAEVFHAMGTVNGREN